MDKLEIQLRLFPTLLHVKEKFNFRDVVESIRSMSSPMRTMITEVVKLMKFILLTPASNAEGEKIFSGVRRVKTYLHSTMKQDRLNDLMMIHVHKDRIDRLSIITRRVKFRRFREQDLKLTAGETRSVSTQTSSS